MHTKFVRLYISRSLITSSCSENCQANPLQLRYKSSKPKLILEILPYFDLSLPTIPLQKTCLLHTQEHSSRYDANSTFYKMTSVSAIPSTFYKFLVDIILPTTSPIITPDIIPLNKQIINKSTQRAIKLPLSKFACTFKYRSLRSFPINWPEFRAKKRRSLPGFFFRKRGRPGRITRSAFT